MLGLNGEHLRKQNKMRNQPTKQKTQSARTAVLVLLVIYYHNESTAHYFLEMTELVG